MARERKEERKISPDSKGLAGFVLGIISIVLFLFSSFVGIVLSVIGLVLSIIQDKKHKTKYSKRGIILNIIGLALNIIMFVVNFFWLSPYINQLYSQQLSGIK